MHEIVDLIIEAKIKLNAINVNQLKWKLSTLKKSLAENLCCTLNGLGFCDNKGKIIESDEPPAIKFQFGWDSKMQLTVARDLLGRHGYILQQNEMLQDFESSRKEEQTQKDIPLEMPWHS